MSKFELPNPNQLDNETEARAQVNDEDLTLLKTFSEIAGNVLIVEGVVGFVGNALAMAVLHRKAFRQSSSAVYLRSLAFVDSIIIIGIIMGMNPESRGNFCENVVMCYLHDYLGNVMTDMGVWILMLFTSERLIAVLRPYEAKSLLTVRRSLIALSATFLTFLVINSHDIWFINRNRCLKCTVFYPEGDITQDVIMSVNMAKALVLPVPVMGISCIIIIVHVQRAKKKREEITNANFTNSSKNGNQEAGNKNNQTISAMTVTNSQAKLESVVTKTASVIGGIRDDFPNQTLVKSKGLSKVKESADNTQSTRGKRKDRGLFLTLVSMNVLFIVTRVPAHVYKFVSMAETGPKPFMVKSILFVFIMLNHTLNMFLYAGTGSKFRVEFLTMLMDIKRMCKRR